jgi:hypothetical protein
MDCGASRFGGPVDEVSEGVDGAAPVQSLARPVVEQISNRVQRDLIMHGQVGAFGKHLPEQPVGVLAGPSLPGAVRVAEVHPHVGVAPKITIPGHLLALVVGQGLTHGLRDVVELEGNGGQRRFRGRIRHSCKQHQARRALHQHADGGLVARTLDEIAFPLARHDAIGYLRRPEMDAHHLRDLATPILPCRARLAPAPALAQAGGELFAQLPLGVRVDGVVDGLVRDMQFGLVGPHASQCVHDLLWRPQPAEHVCNQRPRGSVGVKLASRPSTCTARLAGSLGTARSVRTCCRIARQLAAEGAGAAPQGGADGSQAHALQPHRRQHHALFSLHLLESSRHLHTLPYGLVCRAPANTGSILAHRSSFSTFSRVQISGATSASARSNRSQVSPDGDLRVRVQYLKQAGCHGSRGALRDTKTSPFQRQ